MSLVGTALLGVQGLLGVAELAAGGTKLAGADSQVELYDHLGYPQWFRLVTGGLELLIGLSLLIDIVTDRRIGLVGSVLAAAVLIGALGSHVRAGDSIGDMVPAAGLLALALVVVWNQIGGPA